MDHAQKERQFDKEEFSACCKKLENFVNEITIIWPKKALTTKELQGILQNIYEMNCQFEDMKV